MDRDFAANELLVLLDWYREMGVTHVVDPTAAVWLRRGDQPPGAGFQYPQQREPVQRPVASPSPAPPAARTVGVAQPEIERQKAPPAPARKFPTTTPDAAELDARAQAAKAGTIDDLRLALDAFDGCALRATAKNLCFYRGAEQARLMVIGEAPGRDEDIAGRPFVGAAGQLLDRMLASIGQGEVDTHITNIVYWRPPGNRTPTPQEAQICRPFLERQIELVRPDILLLLGGAAAKHILQAAEGIMRLRGSWREVEIGGRAIQTMASLHPAYLLRTASAKRQAWADLLAVKIALRSASQE